MIKDMLQGKPIGHPMHPVLVHLPIGLWTISLFFDAFALATRISIFVDGSFHMILTGVVCAILAAVPGFADYSDIRRDHSARRVARWHMILNLAAVTLYAINVFVRFDALNQPSPPTAGMILSVLGIGLVVVSGYLGGILVYDDGIGVGRHRMNHAMPAETIRRNEQGAEGFVAVADAADLAEGKVLRVEVQGQVMAVLMVDGQPCAVQEFCTHRFGPMSEGAIEGTNLRCPWHNSCFDVRDGKVTAGPAKEPLKTWPARIRDGKVEIGVSEKA